MFETKLPKVASGRVNLPDVPNEHLIRAREYSEKSAELVTKANKELERGGAISGPLVYNKPI
jgi:hypothetical protein